MKEIINFLKPYTTRAYLVGGASRDILMGKTPTDFDIEIYDISPQFFEKLMLKLGAKGVGKSFFVYKYKNFDLSLPRIENKNGYGHTGFEVKITQSEKANSLNTYDGKKNSDNAILDSVNVDNIDPDAAKLMMNKNKVDECLLSHDSLLFIFIIH